MFPHPYPRWVHSSTVLDIILPPREVDATHEPKYSHGLAGVDQIGNNRWVLTLGIMFAILGGATLLVRFLQMGHRHIRHCFTMGQTDQAGYSINKTQYVPWIYRHIITAPLWKKRHNRSFQLSAAIDNGTLPGRWHTILLVFYGISNLAYCLDLPWHDPDGHSVAAALRGRSGTLAMFNFIPTVLFALRNNPLIPILQVSYDDFNLLHRWVARITIVEVVVHSLSWIISTANKSGWGMVDEMLRDNLSYAWGMVGTVSFVFILVQAWSPIRHAFYETFLNIHRLCVYLAVVGAWVHLEKHGLPQLPWLKIIVALYFLEIGVRMLRAGYLTFDFRKLRMSRITVEAMPGEACRVTIDLVRPWRPKPGSHVHMYMPRLAGYASHPFSVAWASETAPTSKEMTLPMLEGEPLPCFVPPKSKQISLICRARTGFTRKMWEKAAASPDLVFTTYGAIEGPYGGHHSLDSYGTVILFAGGVGITHQVMYVKHLLTGFSNKTTSTQRVVLVWTVPDSECLEWVRPWMDEILRLKGRKQVLRVMLFISRPKKKLENISESVKMFPGRPKHGTLLDEELRNRVGSTVVTCCGSGAFADDVRAAVRDRIQVGAVDFIEEAFTY